MIKNSIIDLQFDIRKIAEYAAQKKDCIRADIGEPQYSPPKNFTEILQNLLPTERFEYAPTFGVPELISSLKNFENMKVRNFSNPQFCVTTGAQAGIFSICNAVLSPHDEIIVHKAYYPPYKSIATLCGAKIIEADFYDIDALQDSLTEKTKIIIINSPNNPTGDIFSETVLKNIADIAKKQNILLLSDDVYDRLLFSESPEIPHISQFAPEQTVVCNSVSKSLCLTGIRIGWILGEEKYISEIAKVHRNINSCPVSTFQRAVAQYLPKSQEYFENYRKSFQKKSEDISAIFSSLGWEYHQPKGAMYIWVTLPKIFSQYSSEECVYRFIDEAGVSGVPGKMFGEHNDNIIRFCFGALSNDEIREFGKRILGFMRKM